MDSKPVGIPENQQSMYLDKTNGAGKPTVLESLLLATQVSNKSTSDCISTDTCTGEQLDVQSKSVNPLADSSSNPTTAEQQDHSAGNATDSCNNIPIRTTEVDNAKKAMKDAGDNENSSSSSSSSSSSDSEDSSSGIDDTLFENLGEEERQEEPGEMMKEGEGEEKEVEEGEKEGRGGIEGGEEQHGRGEVESGEENKQLLAQGGIEGPEASQEVGGEQQGVGSGEQMVVQDLQGGGGQVMAQEEGGGGQSQASEDGKDCKVTCWTHTFLVSISCSS